MTEETNNIENHSVGGSVAVGRDVTVGGRSTIRGNATFNRDVYISGWLNARNIRGAGKGLYETVDKLNSAYPNPENGWFALVGDTLPADIYRAWGGEWKATGQKGGEPVLELARLTELSESLENEVSARVAADEALQTAMNENVKELKGADTEHESRLLALEQSEWPLSLELSINPILIEFTGSEKDTSVAWKIMRKGVGVTPTVLTFKQDGVALSAELSANGSINAKVNKLGDTVFEIAVEAEGMKKSASKKLTMVLPVYMGFAGASDAAGLAITELSKYAPLASPAGTYKIKNNADGIYLWLCVPDTMTINKVTSSGFTVPMREVQTGQTELGGYKCYRSSNAIVAGEYTYTIS